MGYTMGNFGNTSEQSKIEQFKAKMAELTSVQKKVDAGLARMPSGPAKDKLLKLRSESRGFFSNYILPAWNKVKDVASGAFGEEDMGAIPLVGWAAAAIAATAGLGYVGKSLYTEYQILNDPSFTAAQKAQLLGGGGIQGITSALGQAKTLVIVAVIGLIAWQVMKMRKDA